MRRTVTSSGSRCRVLARQRQRSIIPDYQDLLQLSIWQEYDITPDFPTLKHFLDYWEREIEGPLHSVRVAHHRLIQPSEWRAVGGVITLQ